MSDVTKTYQGRIRKENKRLNKLLKELSPEENLDYGYENGFIDETDYLTMLGTLKNEDGGKMVKINMNKFAVEVAKRESGKVNLPITQIKEVIRCTMEELSTYPPSQVLEVVERY